MPVDPLLAPLMAPLADLGDPLAIPCLARGGKTAFEVTVRPPGSKSLTNRALLLAALASGSSRLRGALLDADDAQRMLAALSTLGARIEARGDEVVVEGVGGTWRPDMSAGLTLNLNNAGTATRFLAAAAIHSPVPITIDGNARMRERPIGELIEALTLLDVRARYGQKAGFPPVTLTPPAELSAGATLEIPTTLSSQFVSALLLVAPWLPGGLTIRLIGEITSVSYVQMTVALLDRLGAAVRTSDDLRVIRVASRREAPSGATRGGGLGAFELDIEPDASGATYFWTAGAIVPGALAYVSGLGGGSLQGDAEYPAMLERMGATLARERDRLGVRGPDAGTSLTGIAADLSLMPDAAMSLAVACAFAAGPSTLTGLRTLRVKETDRIAAMQAELAKIGVRVEARFGGDDGAIRIVPPEGGVDCSSAAARVEFDTYDDHRMAMSMALVGLRRPNVWIRDPRCVAKTYATYWRDLAALVAAGGPTRR